VRDVPAHRRWVWAAFLLAAFVVFFRLGSLPLMDPDEGRNAEVAREMSVSGYSLVPTMNGIDYLDKPPLYFALVATSLRAFGVSELAARLPSALAGLATLLVLFTYLRPRVGEREAALAVVVGATAPLLFAFARLVIFDATLGFFVTSSILAAAVSEEAEEAGDRRRARKFHLLSALACAIATLVKGPVGFVVPLLVVVIYRRLARRRWEFRFLVRPGGAALFLVIALAWFLGTVAARPDFLRYGLVEETFHRLTTGSFNRDQPFYFYLPVAVGGLFAWSLLLPEMAWAGWRARGSWRRSDLLFGAWSVAVFVSFSLSRSKQPMYVLTGIVALAALVASGLERGLSVPGGRAGRLLARGAAIWSLVAAGLGATLWVASRPTSALAERLTRNDALAARTLPELGALGIGLLAVATVAAAAAWRRRPALAVVAFALFPPVLLSFGGSFLKTYAGARSARAVATRLESAEVDRLACYGCFPPSLLFYLGRPLTVIERRETPLTMGSNYIAFRAAELGRWPERIVAAPELESWLSASTGRVGLLAPTKYLPELASLRRRWPGIVDEPAPSWSLLSIQHGGAP